MVDKNKKNEVKKALLKLGQIAILPDGYKVQASGCYEYFLNYKKTTIIEPWTIAVNSNKQTLIQSARFVEDQQLTILVEHLTYDNGTNKNPNITPCGSKILGNISLSSNFDSAISWFSQGELIKSCRFQYQTEQNTINWTNITKTSSTNDTFTLPSNGSFQFFPLMRVFTGLLLQNLANHSEQNIIVPDIRTSHIQSSLFDPYMSVRSANFLNTGITSISGKNINCHEFNYLSDIYHEEDNAKFWLNNNNLLAKYQWQQSPKQFWQVELYQVN